MKLNHFIPALLLFAVSLVLLCLPGSTLPRARWFAVIHADKIAHIGIFCLLVLCFAWPFRQSALPASTRKTWFFAIMLLAVGYGVGMEFVQKYWIAGRSFEIDDIRADSAGAVIGFFLSRWKFLGEG